MKKNRILLIDDEREITLILSEILELEGYEVETASNGWHALDRIPDFRPDLIISDIMMPVINGLQLLEKIRALPGFKATPVIMMSAVDPRIDQKGHRWDGFLKKPFELETVLMAVHGCLPLK